MCWWSLPTQKAFPLQLFNHFCPIQEILRDTANKHGLVCLLHEKPFAYVNGSGKHNNWSMSTNRGKNLLNPGETPEQNLTFLMFLTAVLRAVHIHSDLLRASVAVPGNQSTHLVYIYIYTLILYIVFKVCLNALSPYYIYIYIHTHGCQLVVHANTYPPSALGNDYRLGANEAPPAIISAFLGDHLNNVCQSIIQGNNTISLYSEQKKKKTKNKNNSFFFLFRSNSSHPPSTN